MAIRRAIPGDEDVLRDVRLQALADAPHAFGSTHEREVVKTPDEWRARLTNGATFLLEVASAPMGLVSCIPDSDDPAARYLVSMWVHPDLRGQRLGDGLVGAVLEWAKSDGAHYVRLDVNKDNGSAQRLYERNGFRATGHEYARERDGWIEIEMRCELAPG